MCVHEQKSRHLNAALIRMVGSRSCDYTAGHSCKHLVPATWLA